MFPSRTSLFVVLALVLVIYAQVPCQSNSIFWVGQGSSHTIIDMTNGGYSYTHSALIAEGFEGTSAYTHTDNTLWFVTDGLYLYDLRGGQTNLISSSLPGNPSTSVPALIMSVGQGIFYLFCNSANFNVPTLGTTSVYIIDSSFIPAIFVQTIPDLIQFSGEGSVIIQGRNAYTFWFCTFVGDATMNSVTGTMRLTCLEFDPSGILRTVTNDPFSWNVNFPNAWGNLKFYAPTNTLLVCLAGEIHLFDFDRTTALISNDRFYYRSIGTVGYSGEFSPDGSKIYYTDGQIGSRGIISRIDIATSTRVTYPTFTNSGGMTLAVDGNIWVIRPFQTTMYVIRNPDDTIANPMQIVPVNLAPGVIGGYNGHVTVPCGLSATACPSNCDDGLSCTIDTCLPDFTCQNVPTAACGGAGGDPHLFSFDGSEFSLELPFEDGKHYLFYNSPDVSIVIRTSGSPVTIISAIGIKMKTHQFLASLDDQGDPQFYLNGNLLSKYESAVTLLGNVEVFVPDPHELVGPLAQLARYVQIGAKIENLFTVVGGYHPRARGFFNIAVRESHDSSHGLLAAISSNLRDIIDLQQYETSSLF